MVFLFLFWGGGAFSLTEMKKIAKKNLSPVFDLLVLGLYFTHRLGCFLLLMEELFLVLQGGILPHFVGVFSALKVEIHKMKTRIQE